MTLIPKVDNMCTFKEFQLISLCNVTSKLVSKVVVNKLQHMLNDIVSPIRSSFNVDRETTNNKQHYNSLGIYIPYEQV